MARWALAAAVCCVATGSLCAQAPNVDRRIGKQPVYKTASKYGLLAFGPEDKDRVWLVRDGDTLYVDRNGNGDLTEPGERFVAANRSGHDPAEEGYMFEVGDLTVGGRTHKGLIVAFMPLKNFPAMAELREVKAALAKDPKATAVILMLDAQVPGVKGAGIDGRVTFTAGPLDPGGLLRFAASPSDAPVIRVGGPMQIGFYLEKPTLRVGRSTDVNLVVGFPGIGPGTFAAMAYENTIPESAKPIMDISYQPGKPGETPFRELFEIKNRC